MNILLVDDDRATRESVSLFIQKLGHNVTCGCNGREALELFENGSFQLIITDIQMPDIDGFELMRTIRKKKSSLVDMVVITGHSNLDNAVTALREGAYDYLQKPINIDELAIIIERVSEHLSLKMTNRELTSHFEETVKARVSETENKLEKIYNAVRGKIGYREVSIHSTKLQEIFKLAEKFHCSSSVPVLLEGETGTGKEVLAQFIHYGPEISIKPFIAINCAAIPAELFESELFGHEPGSFTGSGTISKKGKLELAEDGTVLLDEIGDMPINMQAKLLRVIEEREFYRVGGVKKLRFNARIIAATNKSLSEETKTGGFRSDLYHRLNVGFIEIPPLRERKDEIIPLAIDFIEKASSRYGRKTFTDISDEARRILENHPWPGNIRQLENTIERIVLLYDDKTVKPEHLFLLEPKIKPETVHSENEIVILDENTRFSLPSKGLDLDKFIDRLIQEAMIMSGNNKTLAAKILNISPRTISRRLDKTDEE